MTLDPKTLGELERMEKAATAGPWTWQREDASMLGLLGPRGEADHVLSTTRCEACQQSGGPCLDPKHADAQRRPSDLLVDWSSPLALYAALHWLSTRGHDCWWMLPTTHGGRAATWTQAAILVSVSVGRVVRGLAPVCTIDHAYTIPTNTRMSSGGRFAGAAVYWTATEADRDYYIAPTRLGPDVKATPDHPGWLYTPPIGLTSWGYEVEQAAVDRINACALADGAALVGDDGAVVVGVPE